jgi:hypothetical protein
MLLVLVAAWLAWTAVQAIPIRNAGSRTPWNRRDSRTASWLRPIRTPAARGQDDKRNLHRRAGHKRFQKRQTFFAFAANCATRNGEAVVSPEPHASARRGGFIRR